VTRASTPRRRRRILVVENDPERLDQFRNRFGPTMVEARDFRQATAALSKHRFAEVWLDFDLNGRRNGADVAYAMRTLPRRRRPTRVVCHSTNLRGAHAVFVTLKNVGFNVETQPFPLLLAV
jgi:CheY-like chemotaxis protein